MRSLLIVGCLLISGTTQWPLAARADWLVFARGGQVELPAAVLGPTVVVTTPGGSLSFPRAAFRSIVPRRRDEDEWRDREATAEHNGSLSARFAATWWALEHGLTPEASGVIRSCLQDPEAANYAPLVRMGRSLDRLALPVRDADLSPLRPQIGGPGWFVLQGSHVSLWYQGGINEARERLDVLDRVVTTFYLSLAAQGVELVVPERRLLSVWFARQGDYAEFLRQQGAAPFANTQGYYHPTHGVVFAYDTRSGEDQVRARLPIDHQRKNLPIAEADPTDLDRQLLLADLRWRSVDLGIAAHETIHQLVAASGLVTSSDDWPNWLHEGFAAQFEVVRGGRWAGFGRVNDLRIGDWRAVGTTPQIAPLLRDSGLIHGYHRDRYAESWALVAFLRKTRPVEFVTFLDLLRNPRPRKRPNDTAAAFHKSFGTDLEAMSREWRSFMKEQMTPSETDSRRVSVAKSF